MKNKTRFLARGLLLVLLLSGALNLSSCEWGNAYNTTTIDDIDDYIPNYHEEIDVFDDFQGMTDFVCQNNSKEYCFFTFNFDNSDDYLIEEYEVITSKKYAGSDRDNSRRMVDKYLSRVGGEIIVSQEASDNYVKIKFISKSPSLYKNIALADDIDFEIKALPEDYHHPITFKEWPKYRAMVRLGVYLEDNLVIEFLIAASSLELLNESKVEVCDILREHIVVLK